MRMRLTDRGWLVVFGLSWTTLLLLNGMVGR
jgi:hypothetical protein